MSLVMFKIYNVFCSRCYFVKLKPDICNVYLNILIKRNQLTNELLTRTKCTCVVKRAVMIFGHVYKKKKQAWIYFVDSVFNWLFLVAKTQLMRHRELTTRSFKRGLVSYIINKKWLCNLAGGGGGIFEWLAEWT